MIKRELEDVIRSRTGQGKAIIIMGARQTGKTTLLHQVIGDNPNVLWLNADDDDVREMFSNISADRLKAIMGNKNVLVIDEAQRIADVGLRLKIITDQMPEVQLFVTGSSSFDLANKINEPLTGRKWEYHLYPFRLVRWLVTMDCLRRSAYYLIASSMAITLMS